MVHGVVVGVQHGLFLCQALSHDGKELNLGEFVRLMALVEEGCYSTISFIVLKDVGEHFGDRLGVKIGFFGQKVKTFQTLRDM